MHGIRPTWYAGGDSWYGELWTMLHPPYTLMVLSFVIVGAVLSSSLSFVVLLATLLAYFLGLGVGAHFLDQLPGMGSRYVQHWPPSALWAIGLGSLGAGVGLGVLGAAVLHEPYLLVLVAFEGVVAVGYPLAPIFRGAFHRDSVFAIAWGSLPCLTSYYAQAGSISATALLAAGSIAVVAVVEIRVSRASRRRRSPPSVVGDIPARPLSHTNRGPWNPDTTLRFLSVGTVVVAAILLGGRALIGW